MILLGIASRRASGDEEEESTAPAAPTNPVSPPALHLVVSSPRRGQPAPHADEPFTLVVDVRSRYRAFVARSDLRARTRAIAIGVGCALAAFWLGRWSADGSTFGSPTSADDPAAEHGSAELAASDPVGGEPDRMAAGLDALYGRRDPLEAAASFRALLAQNPQHYGATYQLAVALEQLGDRKGARQQWQRSLEMASAIGDETTAATARRQLAEQDAAVPANDPLGESMRAGLVAMHRKHDPLEAIAHFRRVLASNPEHYGATYQLAAALDLAGKSDEARAGWANVLKMAEANADEPTAASARRRLSQYP